MAFQYQPFVNPYAASIGETLAHQNDAQAHAAEVIGATQAHAQEGAGQVWGRAIESVGQLPTQIADMRDRGQLANLRQSEIDQNVVKTAQQKRAVAGQQLLGTLTQQYTKVDPVTGVPDTDHDLVAQGLSAAGYGDEAEKYLHGATATAEDREKLSSLKRQTANATAEAVGRAAKDATDPNDFLVRLDHLTLSGDVPQPVQQKFQQEIQQAGPDGWPAVQKRYVDWADSVTKPITLKKDEKVIAPVSGKVLADNTVAPPPTEASLAADAATLGTPNETPTARISAGAVQLLKAPKSPDAQAKDFLLDGKPTQGAFVPDPNGGKYFYNGEDVTARVKPVRDPAQAAVDAVNAASDRQKASELFQQQSTGRHELSEKIEQPYNTAVGSAQTLRDVVASAKAGNKIAGSLQNLETTMTAVRAAGLNRVNMAEIGLPATAGSVWDRLESGIGKLTEGQPVPATLQNDMLQFADILEKGAYKKYSDGWDDTTTRYRLDTEKKKPPPGAPAEGTEGNVGGKPAVWTYIGGKWGWAPK